MNIIRRLKIKISIDDINMKMKIKNIVLKTRSMKMVSLSCVELLEQPLDIRLSLIDLERRHFDQQLESYDRSWLPFFLLPMRTSCFPLTNDIIGLCPINLKISKSFVRWSIITSLIFRYV